MIEIAVLNQSWSSTTDWDALCDRCLFVAVAATPYAALATSLTPVEVSIKFTSDAEVQSLNRDYRGKDRPTNVLSFPMFARTDIAALATSDDPEILLGDIVLAQGICQAEASKRGVLVTAHATHLLVHGLLHLLGYDHIGEDEAVVMETLEQKIMAQLGLHNPYEPVEE